MRARYEGHCDLCDQPIVIGQTIAMVNGQHVHQACAETRWDD